MASTISITHRASLIDRIYARRLDIALILIIFIFAFSVRYVTLQAPGITWDEPTYVHASIGYVDNILHLNLDPGAFNDNSEQPPVSKYIYGAAIWAFNGGKDDYGAYVVVKTVSAIMGAITCVLAYLMGREFFDAKTGALSALILALIPDFVAHTQIAALDSPLAMFFTLTLLLFMMGVKTGKRGYYIASAISLGLLVDTKFTGILVLPIMGILFLAYRYTQRKTGQRPAGLEHYPPVANILCFFLIAALTAIAIYPWIWGGAANINETLGHWAYLPTEYFLGHDGTAPLGYYPVYFMVTTPTLLFLPLALGIFYVIRSRDPFKIAVLLLFLVPFGYDLSSFKQDGMRYLLMIYPAVGLLCGEGINVVSTRAGDIMKDRRIKRLLFFALGALTLLYLVATLASVSPYYLDYYNALAGGPAGANDHRSFEIGWWGEGIYDSAMYIERTAPHNSTVFVAAKPSHVIFAYARNDTYIQFNSDTMNVFYPVDYIITNTYTDRYDRLIYDQDEYRLVYETKVQGVPLAKVYQWVPS